MDIDLDISLTGEMLAARDTCHRFAKDVLRPVGATLDRMEPEAVVAKDSPL